MDSRAKGKRGELEAAEALGRIGLDCRRSAQYCGKAGDADLICDGVALHVEVKLTERLNPYGFIGQAIGDAKSSKCPVVVMRSSYKPWLVLMRLDDVPRFVEEMNRAHTSVRSEVEGAARDTQGVPRLEVDDDEEPVAEVESDLR